MKNDNLEKVKVKLQQKFGKRFTTNKTILERHGKDEAYYPVAPPDGVVFPQSTNEVRDIVLTAQTILFQSFPLV